MAKTTKEQFVKILSERISKFLMNKVLSDRKKELKLKLEAFDTDDFLWGSAADAARADIEHEQGKGSWSPFGDQEDTKQFVRGLEKATEKDVDAHANDWKNAYESFGEKLTAHITQDNELSEFSSSDPHGFLDSMAVAMYKYMMDRHANTPFLSAVQQWIVELDDQFDPTDENGEIQLNHIEARIYRMLSGLEKTYNKGAMKKRLREERNRLMSQLNEVWEWSHTQEAYDGAKENLSNLSHDDLVEIMLEWNAYEAAGESNSVMDADFDSVDIEPIKAMSHDLLVDVIFEKAETLRSSDNGGHRLWMCPYGCHTVSPDVKEEIPIDEAGKKGVTAPFSDMIRGSHDPKQTYDWAVLFLDAHNNVVDDSKKILNKTYSDAMKEAKAMIPSMGDEDIVSVDLEEAHRDIVYQYHIDLDERGSFLASVRDEDDKVIYTIRAGDELGEDESSIFEDGYMKHKNDLIGLEKYLKQLGFMESESTLVSAYNEGIMNEDWDDLDIDGGESSEQYYDDGIDRTGDLYDDVSKGYYVVPPTAEDPFWVVVDQEGNPVESYNTEEEANAAKQRIESEMEVPFKEGREANIENLMNEVEQLLADYKRLTKG